MNGAVITALLLAASLSVKTYDVPQKRIPTEIVRHGNELWFVAWTVDRVQKDPGTGRPKLHAYFGRMTLRGRFRMQAAPPDHMPGLTAHAPDGTLWLGDAAKPGFWRVSRDGRIERVPSTGVTQSIAFGADRSLWTTYAYSPWIGRYGQDGSSKGTFQVPDIVPPPMTSIPPPPPAPRPTFIVAGPDGALWFTETYRRRIGRISTTGEITMFPASPAMGDFSEIVAGPDGALWYTTYENALGRITTSGETSTVPIGFPAEHLETDSRGRIWYTHGGHVGVLERDGTRREAELPKVRGIRSLTEGPDGAMWFADSTAYTIGRVVLSR